MLCNDRRDKWNNHQILTYFTNSDTHSHTGCNGDVCHDFNGNDVDSHHQDTPKKKFIAH